VQGLISIMVKKHIRMYENLRACSYTPFYLAQIEGFFEQEEIQVSLVLSSSPSETAQGLIEGRADVSFGGPMRVMLHHNEAIKRNRTCPLICFAQVVARDPFMLIGREPNNNFQFTDLLNSTIAVAIDVPTPWMTLQDDLSRAGIDPATIKKSPEASMRENSELFKKGQIDVVQVFEPYAQELIEAGGHLWHRFSCRGDIAFTTFYSKKSFTTENRKTCQSLVRAMAKALKMVHTISSRELAEIVGPHFFPELSPRTYASIIEGYKLSNLWPKTTTLLPSAFVKLKGALLSGGLIEHDIPYENVIDEELSVPQYTRND